MARSIPTIQIPFPCIRCGAIHGETLFTDRSGGKHRAIETGIGGAQLIFDKKGKVVKSANFVTDSDCSFCRGLSDDSVSGYLDNLGIDFEGLEVLKAK